MAGELVVSTGARSAEDAMRASFGALDTPGHGDAELTISEITTPAVVLGAFQRHHAASLLDTPLLRRGSGGAFVTVGPGTLHVLLNLAHVSALVACDAGRLVNRYVRPLLRALTKWGALAHYFGRDWISVAHQPVAEVGFAHDTVTGRATFEAFVAVRYPFAPAGRGSFMGKEPRTLEAVAPRGEAHDTAKLSELIVNAYAAAGSRTVRRRTHAETVEGLAGSAVSLADPPWAAVEAEAIGDVAAGRDAAGVLRLGGDLLASRDALLRVAERVERLGAADEAAIGTIVNGELGSPRVALQGVRDLGSIGRVLASAVTRRP